jgi:hypothetical protein
VVFTRGRYGSSIRTKVSPTRSESAATLDVRNRLTILSKAWADLDAGERIAWSTWAATNPITDRLGAQQVLQGSAAFIQLNARILQAAGTKIVVPPIGGPPPALTSASVVSDVSSNTVTVTFAATPLAAGHCLAVWCACLDGAGRTAYKSFRKLIAVSAAAQASTLECHTLFETRFGNNLSGQNLYFDIEVWDNTTGLVSARKSCSCVVTT